MTRKKAPKVVKCLIKGCDAPSGHGPIPPFRTMAKDHRRLGIHLLVLRHTLVGPIFLPATPPETS